MIKIIKHTLKKTNKSKYNTSLNIGKHIFIGIKKFKKNLYSEVSLFLGEDLGKKETQKTLPLLVYNNTETLILPVKTTPVDKYLKAVKSQTHTDTKKFEEFYSLKRDYDRSNDFINLSKIIKTTLSIVNLFTLGQFNRNAKKDINFASAKYTGWSILEITTKKSVEDLTEFIKQTKSKNLYYELIKNWIPIYEQISVFSTHGTQRAKRFLQNLKEFPILTDKVDLEEIEQTKDQILKNIINPNLETMAKWSGKYI